MRVEVGGHSQMHGVVLLFSMHVFPSGYSILRIKRHLVVCRDSGFQTLKYLSIN